MVVRVVTLTFEGVEARRVEVEVQLIGGEVSFVVVGLADKTQAESRERARHFCGPRTGAARPPDRG
jgi:magnesium chelatase family protein